MLRTVSVVALPISVAALLASASPSNGQPLRTSAYVAKARTQVGDPPPKTSGTYITFDIPNSIGLTPNGINSQGDIVGGYFDTVNSFWQNFVLDNGTVRLVNPPGPTPPSCCGAGGWLATISGINPQGDVVGSENDQNGVAVGFLLSNGAYTTVEVPGSGCGIGTLPAGVNPQGDVVGFYVSDADCNEHGFLWHKDVYTTIDIPASLGSQTQLSAIDPVGDIIGTYNGTDAFQTAHSFLLSQGKLTLIPDVPSPGFNTWALGMNYLGDIVGTSCCGPVSGWLSHDGTVTTINVPGALFTTPYGITPEGDIVGNYADSNINLHGFLLKR